MHAQGLRRSAASAGPVAPAPMSVGRTAPPCLSAAQPPPCLSATRPGRALWARWARWEVGGGARACVPDEAHVGAIHVGRDEDLLGVPCRLHRVPNLLRAQ
eukprot:4867636-Prymnesium_polylepis.1